MTSKDDSFMEIKNGLYFEMFSFISSDLREKHFWNSFLKIG
jgi:hypothetical protein